MAVGDVLLVFAAAALLLALVSPRLRRVALDQRVETANADVETLLTAVRRHREQGGDWPQGRPVGRIPPELAEYLPPDYAFRGRGHALKWDRWERVLDAGSLEAPDLPEDPEPTAEPPTPAPPDSLSLVQPTVVSFGGLTLRSDDARVLSALMERFGASRSFVRGTGWTLILTDAATDTLPMP